MIRLNVSAETFQGLRQRNAPKLQNSGARTSSAEFHLVLSPCELKKRDYGSKWRHDSRRFGSSGCADRGQYSHGRSVLFGPSKRYPK
jgi:hypothetical protein